MTDAQSGKNRKIKIKIPEYYKPISAEVWEELEKYLFTGFLISFSRIHDHTLIFKTLNYYELQNIGHFRPMRKSPPEIQAVFQATFIAHSIFCIDGENTLFERPHHIRKLVEIISKLDAGIQEDVLDNLKALNDKANRLSPLVEVYVHENRSKLKWLQIKNIPIHSPLVTGIAGTDELGMNYCQQLWVALNHLQDIRDQLEADWGNAKFIGSCFNSKGIRSIDEKDRNRKQIERQKQEDQKMKVLYAYLNRSATGELEELPENVMMPDGRMAKVEKRFIAESAEELADQLSAALSGDKDLHDKIVEEQQKKNRKRAESIERYRRQFYQRPPIISEAAHASSIPLSGGSRVLGGGRAEVDRRLGELRDIERSKRALYKQVDLDLDSNSSKPYHRVQGPNENSDKT